MEINESTQAELALKHHEVQLAAFLEFIPSLILIKDVESRPVFANHNFKKFFPFDENLGMRPHDTLPAGIADQMIKEDQEALKKGYISYEENWVDKLGRERTYFTQKFIIDIPGSSPLIGVISSDITEKKEAELILKEKLAEVEKINKIMVGRELKMIELKDEINELCKKLNLPVRYSSPSRVAELTGTVHELEEARSASINLVEDLSEEIEKRKKIEGEILLLNQTLEDRVKDRTEQLEESMREIEAFSYSVSHDLRTPLRALNGFSSILIEDYSSSLDSEGIRMLTVIRNNANRMGQLIDDLLEFSRLNRGEINYHQINMEKMAKEVYEELASRDKKERIVFSVKPLPDAWGDTSMIRQVWHNLIGNAIKFSSNKQNPSIEIGFLKESSRPCFFIKDNGVGFDPNFQDKLFGVFQRLHGITEFEGTGVGLAIVQRIIQRHDGKVWAEGKVGEGAVFYFTLEEKFVLSETGIPDKPIQKQH